MGFGRGTAMTTNSLLRDRIIPVGTILLAIIIAWYVAAYRMNAPFQRDLNERSGL